ncbi:THAP domain-containing protein 3 [Amia ocellicauda]|uniref:THAP domain-containing protein 3 n=1 Tax=Amia ocellicauda TaxID=2972642 RepID=UPI003463D45B
MPKSCSAYNCTNRYSSKNPDLTFHRFPLSKPTVLKEWLHNIARDDFQPNRHMVLCSQHFTPDCFNSYGNRKNLLWNAVPTVFSFPPLSSKRKKSRKRLRAESPAVVPRWEELWLEEVGPQQEEVGPECREQREGPVAMAAAECRDDQSSDSAPQELWPCDHSYSLAEPGAVKARLFSTLEANERLRKRLKVKCEVIRKMSQKLQAAHRELGTLRAELSQARAGPGQAPPTRTPETAGERPVDLSRAEEDHGPEGAPKSPKQELCSQD